MTLALVAAGTACGGDGGTNPPTPVVTTIVKQTATDEQVATVASEVTLAPSVVVRDQNGEPMAGVTVTFAVTAGGGSLTGATPETDDDGLATVGSWTLGTSMGENTLVASAAGKTATFTATGTPGAPSVVARVAGTDDQSATVGTAVPIAPAIRVSDAHDNPIEGVEVVFAVSGELGSITGATQTTGEDGIAAVGSWTLGSEAGLHGLSATAEGLDAIAFTAMATAGAAASITIDPTTDAQSATAGAAVGASPSVYVTDEHGNAVAGVEVTFAVTMGAGSVTGGTQTTDANGVATVGSWTLGTTAGENRLSATTASLDAVTFTATGTAGAAASLTKVLASDEQTGSANQPLPIDPAVVVADAHGNPVSGVTVTFAIAAGGGVITDSVQVSDASGLATLGSWTLGPYNDINELTASAAGLEPVTFVAAPDGCTVSPPLAVGSSFDGELIEWDCLLSSNRYHDFYLTEQSGTAGLHFTVTSSAFDPLAHLFDADGKTRGFDVGDAGDGTGSLWVIAPAGTYQPAATSVVEATLGTYTIAAATAPTNVTGCSAPWVVRGVTLAQTLATTDCVEASGPWYTDEYYIYLHAGETVTFTMTSTAMNTFLQLYHGDGTFIVDDDSSAGGTNARLTYTVTTTGAYILVASAYTAQTGAYTLQIIP